MLGYEIRRVDGRLVLYHRPVVSYVLAALTGWAAAILSRYVV